MKLSRFGVTAAFTGTAGVREMAESRLRAARIWGGREDDDGEADPLILHINYGSTRATFRKEVWDPLSGEFYISEVWTRVLLGTDLEAEESQRASTLTDRFILNYLRVKRGGLSVSGPGAGGAWSRNDEDVLTLHTARTHGGRGAPNPTRRVSVD